MAINPRIAGMRAIFAAAMVLSMFVAVSRQTAPSIEYAAPPPIAPVPLLQTGHPVDWWFVCQGRSETGPLGRRKTRPDEFVGDGDWQGGWRLERRPAVRGADRV